MKEFAKRMASRVCAASLAAIACAQDTKAGKYCEVEIVRGRLAEDVAALLLDDVVAAADLAGPAIEKALQTRLTEKAKIVFHAQAASFRAVEKEKAKCNYLTEAFVVADGSAAHVLLDPPFEKELLMSVGLPEPTRQRLIRCAAHALIVQRWETAARDRWLAEVVSFGLLEGITNPRRAADVDPLFDERSNQHTGKWAAAQAGLRDQIVFPKDAGDRSGADSRDKCAAVLSRFLADQDSGWARRILSKPPKPTDTVANRARIADSWFGRDWDKAEAKWRAFLKSQRDGWEPHGHVVRKDGAFVMAAGEATALLWPRSSVVPEGPYAVRCACTWDVLSDGGSLRIQLDWDGKSLIAVFLCPRMCAVEVHEDGVGWLKPVLAQKELVLRPGATNQIEVTVTDDIVLAVDGVETIRISRKGRTMRGSWSLAANHCVVRLTNPRLEAVPPAKK